MVFAPFHPSREKEQVFTPPFLYRIFGICAFRNKYSFCRMSETNIKVIVFEDNNHLRESLYFLISSSNGFECGGAFPDTRQAVPLVQKLQPDVIVMDIEMPGMNGIDTTRLIKKEFPDARILILTVFEDQDK